MRRIKMILPAPLSPAVLAAFQAQIPPSLKRPQTELTFVGTRGGPSVGSQPPTQYELMLYDAFVVEAGARAEREGFDAVCVYAMGDFGVEPLRSLLSIPVVGTGQTTWAYACTLGRRISVLAMEQKYRWQTERTARREGIGHRVASVRVIDMRPTLTTMAADGSDPAAIALEREGRAAIEQDGADVLMLGGTTMHQYHSFLAARLGVPLLNPGPVAYAHCEALLDLGLAHSKRADPKPETFDPEVLRKLADSPAL